MFLRLKEEGEQIRERGKKMQMYIFGVLGKAFFTTLLNMNARFKCLHSSEKKGFVDISCSREPPCGFF